MTNPCARFMASVRKLGLAACAGTALVLSPPGAAFAAPVESSLSQDDAEAADRFDIDLFAPAGPAFTALGGSPRRVSDPGALHDFKFDFGSIVDGEKSRLGAAFSVVPYWMGDKKTTLSDYRNQTSRFTRILARTQTSIGIARAGGDEREAVRIGFGAQTQLLDAQDHRFDEESYNCIHAAWQRHRAPVHQDTVDSIIDAISAGEALTDEDLAALQEEGLTLDEGSQSRYLDARDSCRDEAAQRLLGKASWQLGFGVGGRSEEDELASFDYDGVSLWTSYRHPVDARGRFAVFTFARGDLDRVFDLDDDLRAEGDSIDAGVGAAYQSPRFRLDVSVAQVHRSYADRFFDDDNFQRYAGIADIRLREGIWLEVSGGTNVNTDLVNGAFGGVNLKVAWGDYLPLGR